MKIITTLFLMAALTAKSQTPVTYFETIQCNGASKAELFTKAQQWFSATYGDTADVIEKQDPTTGEIIATSRLDYKSLGHAFKNATKGPVSYTISLSIQDGAYKYELTNFVHDGQGSAFTKGDFGLLINTGEYPGHRNGRQHWKDEIWNDIKYQTTVHTGKLIISLRQSMK